jgi:hypothetical protein
LGVLNGELARGTGWSRFINNPSGLSGRQQSGEQRFRKGDVKISEAGVKL